MHMLSFTVEISSQTERIIAYFAITVSRKFKEEIQNAYQGT